jgi:hypothetical protein
MRTPLRCCPSVLTQRLDHDHILAVDASDLYATATLGCTALLGPECAPLGLDLHEFALEGGVAIGVGRGIQPL